MKQITTAIISTIVLASWASHADSQQGDLALAEGNVDEAIALYKNEESTLSAKLKLAQVYMNVDLDDAEDWIEQAYKQAPEDAPMHFLRGQIMGMQAGNSVFTAMSYAAKALDSFSAAAQLAPDNVAYQQGLLTFYVQAPGIAGGDIDKAKIVAQTITALDPSAGLQAQIMIAADQDDTQQLDLLITQGLTEFGDDADMLFMMGMLKQNQADYPQAMDLLSKITYQNDDAQSAERYYSAQYQVGKTAILAKSFYPEGLMALNNYIANAQIAEGMPSLAWATYRKANIKQAMGLKTEAKALYNSINSVADKQLKKQIKKSLKRLG